MSSVQAAPTLILVIDGHSVYRHGICSIIEANIDQSRVVEAATADDVDDSMTFDLILIDSASVSHTSLAVLKHLHAGNPRTRLAVISVSNARTDVLNCLAAGYHGFIYKLQSDGEFVAAVKDLLSGRIYVPGWLADVDDHKSERPPSVDLEAERLDLTPRQRQILPMLAQGMSNKEISRTLGIAEGTTKIHTSVVVRLLGARNRTEAAYMAARLVGDDPRSPRAHLPVQHGAANRPARTGIRPKTKTKARTCRALRSGGFGRDGRSVSSALPLFRITD